MFDGTRVKPELAVTAGQWEYVCCHCVVQFGDGGGVVLADSLSHAGAMRDHD